MGQAFSSFSSCCRNSNKKKTRSNLQIKPCVSKLQNFKTQEPCVVSKTQEQEPCVMPKTQEQEVVVPDNSFVSGRKLKIKTQKPRSVVELVAQEPCVEPNSFVTARLRTHSGLDSSRDDLIMFVRPKVVEMWKQLENLRKPGGTQNLHVSGPPGTGKSTVAWAWACFTAKTHNVLWVHLNKSAGRITICHFFNKRMHVEQAGTNEFHDHIKDLAADFLVVDGVKRAQYDNIASAVSSWKLIDEENRKSAIITSAQIVNQRHENSQAYIVEWSMTSWTYSEYKTACEDTDFYNQIAEFLPPSCNDESLEERLLAKHYLAGSSARWFLGTPFDVLPKEIDKQLSKVENKALLLSNISGEKCEGAVGHLRMVRMLENGDEGVFFVSRYVMRKVAESCEAHFLQQAATMADLFGNPAFKGWITEFDFLLRVRQASKHSEGLRVYNNAAKEEEILPVRAIVDNVDPRDTVSLARLSLTTGTWLLPKLWNQGGYDAVFVEGNTLHFVQITSSKKHKLKLRYHNVLSLLHPHHTTTQHHHHHTTQVPQRIEERLTKAVR